MMFNKDDTNFNGESFCKSCVWGSPVYIGVHTGKPKLEYLCLLDQKEFKNVGVCKDYQEYKSNDETGGKEK